MRIIVFGAGAIGSVLTARLALAGHAVAMVARGPHLERIRADGLAFTAIGGDRHRLHVEATERDIPPGDVVLVTLKSHALRDATVAISQAAQRDGIVVFLQNGLPWWYFRDLAGPLRDRPLPTLDPGGVLARRFPGGGMAGGVVTLAASLIQPGHVQHTGGLGLTIGRPDGRADDRLAALAAALADAGFQAELPGDPRPAIWTKLTGNVSMNGVAALTGATIGAIWEDDGLRPLVLQLAAEAMRIAAALGCPISIDQGKRRAAATGSHRSSTLQDIEAGRPIEHEALFGALLPIARELGVQVPGIEMVSALLRRRALEMGCLPAVA
ncbi:MAG TPA: 2-dehydropantoate 2-reductase [Roseomonas sp.]|jgi:2-dehydropantoate 2-reductase